MKGRGNERKEENGKANEKGEEEGIPDYKDRIREAEEGGSVEWGVC